MLFGVLALTAWTLVRSDALDEARLAYTRGDLTNALRRALDHLDRRPWSTDAKRLAGLCLIRLDYPNLVDPYLDVARPFNRDDASLRAKGFERARQTDRAADVYRVILDHAPDDAEALERLSILRGEQGRHRDSLAAAERLARVPEKAAAAEALRGAALLRLGEPGRAATAFEAAFRRDPSLKSLATSPAQFWADGVDALIEAGRAADARRLLEARLGERGDDAVVLDRLAAVAQHDGRGDEAESLWQRASMADPSLSGPWLSLGKMALGRGKADEAVAMLSRAAALAPDDPEPEYNLGLACRLAGKLEESERHRRRADRLRAEHPGRPRGMGASP